MEEIKSKENKTLLLWTLFFLVLIPGSPLMEGGETYHTVIWLRLWILGFALFYFQGMIRKDKIELTVPSGNWMIFLLWAVLSVSLITTHYYYITIYWYSNLLVYLVLFYLVLNLLSEKNQDRKLLTALFFILLSAAVVESLAGMIDYFRFHPGRAGGSFFNPAYYSGYLLALISFPLSALLFDLRPELDRRKKIYLRAGMALGLSLISAGLLVSASRAIIFALIPVGLILLFRFRLKAVLVLILLILAAAFIPNPFRARLKDLKSDPYAWDRITIWKTSARMIQHHPLGVGLGMYQYYYDRDAYPVRIVKIGRFAKTANRAHNEFINLAAECSPLAPALVLAWLGITLWPLVSILARKKQEFWKKEPVLLLAFSASFLGILGHSLVDSNFHQPPIMILAIIDLACIIHLLADFKSSPLKKSSYPTSHPAFLRSFILITGTLIGLMMTYQALIFALTFHAQQIPKPESRLNSLDRLTQLPSGYANLYFQTALDLRNLFFQTENPDFAVKSLPYFEFAAKLNPENYEFFYYWADSLYRLGLFIENPPLLDRAEQIAILSLKRSDHDPSAYLLLANIARLKKDDALQEKWLKTFLEKEPYYLLGRSLLIQLLIGQGRFQEAQAQLDLLKSQKQETDQIPKGQLNPVQLKLISLSDQSLPELEFQLNQKSSQ